MQDQFSRTRRLLGDAALAALSSARVAVFGIGGVGGYVCEALARSGVGAFDLIDNDTVSLTNLNRQIIATHQSLGRYKTDVMRERILDINPEADVRVHARFFLPENAETFPFEDYSYIVDAVDTVKAKLALIETAKVKGIPIISAMGAGNKLEPWRFRVTDLSKTQVDPLARVMRRELKKRGIEHLKVVYSDELPIKPLEEPAQEADTPPRGRKDTPGSTAFAPAAAGLALALEVVRDLTVGSPREDLI